MQAFYSLSAALNCGRTTQHCLHVRQWVIACRGNVILRRKDGMRTHGNDHRETDQRVTSDSRPDGSEVPNVQLVQLMLCHVHSEGIKVFRVRQICQASCDNILHLRSQQCPLILYFLSCSPGLRNTELRCGVYTVTFHPL